MNKQTVRAFAAGLLAASLALFIFIFSEEENSVENPEAMIKALEEENYTVRSAAKEAQLQKEMNQLKTAASPKQEEADSRGANKNEGIKKDDPKQSQSADTKSFRLTISTGMPSSEIGKQLEEAGMINSAKQFNDYLTENGYAEKLQVGSHTVNSSMTLKEIALILTTR